MNECSGAKHPWRYPGEVRQCDACHGNRLVHFELNRPMNCLGCNGTGSVLVLECQRCGKQAKRWWLGNVGAPILSHVVREERAAYGRFVHDMTDKLGMAHGFGNSLKDAPWDRLSGCAECFEYFDSAGIQDEIERLRQVPEILQHMERFFAVNLTRGPWLVRVGVPHVLPALILHAILRWTQQYL